MTEVQIMEDIIKATADFQDIAVSFANAADTYARAMQESLDAIRELRELEAAEIVEEPEPLPAVKLEDVRAILAVKSREGHRDEVKALLEKHGAAKLSEVAPEEYGALAAEAEAIA